MLPLPLRSVCEVSLSATCGKKWGMWSFHSLPFPSSHSHSHSHSYKTSLAIPIPMEIPNIDSSLVNIPSRIIVNTYSLLRKHGCPHRRQTACTPFRLCDRLQKKKSVRQIIIEHAMTYRATIQYQKFLFLCTCMFGL